MCIRDRPRVNVLCRGENLKFLKISVRYKRNYVSIKIVKKKHLKVYAFISTVWLINRDLINYVKNLEFQNIIINNSLL